MKPTLQSVDAKLWASCDEEARALRSAITAGAPVDAQLKQIGSTLEWILCGVFRELEATKQFWCDGVVGDIGSSSTGSITLQGYAWCAGHLGRQWKVPIEVVLDMETQLHSVDFRVGDAKCDSLRDHAERKLRTPEAWLVEVRVFAPQAAPRPDASAHIGRIRAWYAINPQRPIVGLDWEPLDLDQAIDRIRAMTAAGEEPKLEETWLEHGPAMRVI